MADISTIVGVDGSSYTIKDATARGLLNGHSVNKDVPANAEFTDTTYESKQAASGGTDLSLVTTGEKYNWNNASGSGIDISDTQPTDANNKLWIKETSLSEGISIPTMADIEVIENTLNAAEDEVETVENGLAIPQTGDTCSRDSGIPIGAFIFLQGHSSLADGIYQNTSGSIIAKNASFTSSNLTRCYQENGVLNLLAFSIRYFNATKPVVDCNSGTDSIFELFFYTDANTLNTPYKQGLTSATIAIILNLRGSAIYNTQFAFLIGTPDVYTRARGPSGWGAWKKAF